MELMYCKRCNAISPIDRSTFVVRETHSMQQPCLKCPYCDQLVASKQFYQYDDKMKCMNCRSFNTTFSPDNKPKFYPGDQPFMKCHSCNYTYTVFNRDLHYILERDKYTSKGSHHNIRPV